MRDGGGLGEVLGLERQVRLPAVRKIIPALQRLAHQGIPVVLTGDFNSPSALDWTPPVARARAEVPYPVRWPASSALLAAGLADTYREAHPDPVAVPGFTWTPGGPESDPHEVFDRIDWVLRSGPSRTVDSEVVGEVGGPDVGIPLSPYPTDHRGVVSTLDVRPAPAPNLVAPARRSVTLGQPLRVTYHYSGRRPAQVALLDDRGHAVTLRRVVSADGTLRLPTAAAGPGRHELVLSAAGGAVPSRTPVWFYPPGEPVRLAADRSGYRVGQPIGVHFANAPGMGLDWVSVFRCAPAGCDPDSGYLVYAYTGSAIEGRLTIGADAVEGAESWPLPAGRYVLRLLPDDGYRSVAESAPFDIH